MTFLAGNQVLQALASLAPERANVEEIASAAEVDVAVVTAALGDLEKGRLVTRFDDGPEAAYELTARGRDGVSSEVNATAMPTDTTPPPSGIRLGRAKSSGGVRPPARPVGLPRQR